MRPIAAAAFCFCALVLPATAQPSPDLQAIPAQSSLRLESLSFYSAYYSTGLPTNTGQAFQTAIGSDEGLGASATVRWLRNDERNSFSMTYTADYSGQVRYSSLNALNHLFALTVTRHLTPRWNFDFTTSTNVITADRLALLPNELPVTDPLTPLPSQLPGTVTLVSPSLLLYGDRLLSSTATMGLSYDISPRTSVVWRLGGTRYQSLASNNSTADTGLESPIGQSTTAMAGVSVSHTLSARTQVSMNLDSSWLTSGYVNSWYHRASLSATRSFTQHWSAGIRGGAGYIQPSGDHGYPSGASLQYIAGGTLGYSTLEHTFSLSSDHTVGDAYGFGATSTLASSFSWGWFRRGSRWSLRATVTQMQLEGGGLGTIHTWLADASVRRALSRHASISAEYGYMRYSGSTLLGSVSPSTVRLAMIWTPGLGLLP